MSIIGQKEELRRLLGGTFSYLDDLMVILRGRPAKHFGIAGNFTAVIAAEDIHKSKPSPEGYLKSAEMLGMKPEDCMIIEDTPSGVL